MIVRIPFFPLELVPFPGENLNLHIFEPRYRQLTLDCYKGNLHFGILPVQNKKPVGIGVQMKILKIFKTHSDGRMDIKTKGVSAFQLMEFSNKMDGKLYPGGTAELLEDNNTSDLRKMKTLLKLRSKLFSIVNLNDNLKISIEHLMSYDLAHKLGLSMDQEIDLLKMRNETERLNFLIGHLKRVIPSILEIEEMKKKVKMNGHLKNLIPPDLQF